MRRGDDDNNQREDKYPEEYTLEGSICSNTSKHSNTEVTTICHRANMDTSDKACDKFVPTTVEQD